jgi:hypothetical protein
MNSHLPRKLFPVRADKGVSADDQAHTSFGKVGVTPRQLPRWPSVRLAHPFPCGGTHQPIGQGHAVYHGFVEYVTHGCTPFNLILNINISLQPSTFGLNT